jgi:hypothetical protein
MGFWAVAAPIIGGALAAGGSIMGAKKTAEAAESAGSQQAEAMIEAARIQAESQEDAIEELRRQYDITLDMLSPYATIGPQAYASYLGLLAASPLPSQAAAAQSLIDQLGGKVTATRVIPGTVATAAEGAGGGLPAQSWIGKTDSAGDIPSGFIDTQTNDMGVTYYRYPNGMSFKILPGSSRGTWIRTGSNEAGAGGWGTGPVTDTTAQDQFITEEYEIPTLEQIVYEESPGYQWQLGQGLEAIEKSAAARGKQLSGGTLQSMMEYGQGLAAQDYESFLQRYYQSLTPFTGMADTGLNAILQTAGAGQNTASQIASMIAQGGTAQADLLSQIGTAQGQSTLQAGLARASGYQNLGNIMGNTMGSIGSYYQLKELLE